MKQYLTQVKYILKNGIETDDRTGTGTIDCFGYQNRYDLSKGFPILTTKRLHIKSIIYELLWFILGETNIKYLNDHGVSIWDDWADKDGNLGDVYGKQWRSWPTSDGGAIDQLGQAIETIKKNPHSRRILVNAWNCEYVPKMGLPPCHLLYQFYVQEGRLSCLLYQRSSDVFLGVPFNIASYALLTQMVAQVTNLKLGDFIHTFGSHHIYKNHIEQMNLQIQRTPYELPKMFINPDVKHIDDFKFEDFSLGYDKKTEKRLAKKYDADSNWHNYLKRRQENNSNMLNYLAHPHIKGDVSV